MFNCTLAMFKSVRSSTQRTWNRNRNSSSSINVQIIVNTRIEFLNDNFSIIFISDIKRILFPSKKDSLVTIRDLYLDKVFSDVSLKHEILRYHMHFIITDLLMYKIKPYTNDKGRISLYMLYRFSKGIRYSMPRSLAIQTL